MKKEKYIQECCTGCGLCHSTEGTEFHTDSNGYLVPQISHGGGYKYYESVCPVYRYETIEEFNLWGSIEHAYSGYSSDPEIRHLASSGGAITAISLYLLEQGIVDGVIHIGVSEDNPVGTKAFVSRSREELLARAGSRYCISSPMMNMMEMMRDGEKYAFVGKPCDVNALKRYMENVEDISNQIIITLSFFCAGMPSKNANERLIEAIGLSINEVESFRYRGNGWPGYATAVDKSGHEYSMAYESAWGKYLGRDVKKICRYCMDGIGESADIACADFWYLNKDNTPDFSEHDGRNVIFCRNLYADRILKDAADKGYLCTESLEGQLEQLKYCQPYQYRRRVTMKYQLLALRIFGKFAPRYSKTLLNSANKYSEQEMNKSIFVGTVKRILKGRI